MTVRIIYVPRVKVLPNIPTIKGRNDITDEEVRGSVYLKPPPDNRIDVSLVVGYGAPSNDGNLLLCRFHRMTPNISKKKKQNTRVLLQDLQEQLKNNGLERRRAGGSSGEVNYSKELHILLQSHNSSPRCSKGTVFLRDRDNLKWHLFYLGTKDGGVKYSYYTNPVPGGSFKMPSKLLQKYDCLREFASIRPMAALVLEAVQRNIQHTKTKIPVNTVCPVAVEQELKYIENTRHFLKEMISHHEKKKW